MVSLAKSRVLKSRQGSASPRDLEKRYFSKIGVLVPGRTLRKILRAFRPFLLGKTEFAVSRQGHSTPSDLKIEKFTKIWAKNFDYFFCERFAPFYKGFCVVCVDARGTVPPAVAVRTAARGGRPQARQLVSSCPETRQRARI